MTNKELVLQQLCNNRIIAVIRAESREEAYHTSIACIEGGVRSVEITFTIPQPHRIIEDLREKYDEKEVLIGAGTVLDAQTARVAILSGADFIVSPCFDEDMVKLCNRYGVLIAPGAMTPKDVMSALEMGIQLIKIFPIDVMGIRYLHTLSGPFPQVKFLVTGHVGLNQLKDCFDNGASVVGVGNVITAPGKVGDYTGVRQAAANFVAAVNEFKQ